MTAARWNRFLLVCALALSIVAGPSWSVGAAAANAAPAAPAPKCASEDAAERASCALDPSAGASYTDADLALAPCTRAAPGGQRRRIALSLGALIEATYSVVALQIAPLPRATLAQPAPRPLRAPSILRC